MNAATGQPDSVGPNADQALGELRLAWGHACDIGREDGSWVAVSRDSERALRRMTPAGLDLAIRVSGGRP